MPDVYRHEFSSVEDYLHQRDPYLLVRNVESIGDTSIETSTVVTGDEHFLGGHFPGAPIVPGAMLQEMTTQTAGILIAARFNPMEEFDTHDPFFNEYALGVLIRVKGARFRGFARPGNMLHAHVELSDQLGDVFEFRGRVMLNGKVIMSNSFQLANILSATLQGSDKSAKAAE
jgi:3-hydroxyacyl-[acyl-carrier-protein] dehydratase